MRRPDMEGQTGKAWLLSEPKGGPSDWQASLACWVVQAPGRHPFWEWWSMGVIHLRPIPGVRPAALRIPDASHEFVWVALNPDHCPPEARIDGAEVNMPYLVPIDLEHQVAGLTDQQATSILGACVRGVVHYGANPDQDHRAWWAHMLDGTVRHHLAGGHSQD